MQNKDQKIGKRIITQGIEDEMKESYIDYSMSVIIGRALPDVRDGLKPVHRRVLYAMSELGLHHNKPYKKSARVVGEVLGKYHPHGDAAVYDAMVRMVQDFSLRYPLIDGQGNFGSVDGDAPAAMRYTEVRMSEISEEMLADIDKETTDFVPNFDASLQEPTVLPSRFPNLIVNGSSGIAVGMATNMPPHNLREVIDAIIATIKNPDISISEIMQILPGPDFPTGGIIQGRSGIRQAYETGRGTIKIRGRAEVVDTGRHGRIIITEIPYQVNKASLIESIAELVKNKHIDGISDIRDESDRSGMRIVIELKPNAQGEVILNQLYKHTSLETTFGIINLALVDNKPVVLNIRDLIKNFIRHRKQVITRRCTFELKKSEARAHILSGIQIALKNLDQIVHLLRSSKSLEEAKRALITTFNLSEKQAQAVLEMRLQRLTGMERAKVDEEYHNLQKYIKWLKEVLADEAKINNIIQDELLEIKKKYGDERRTEIEDSEEEIETEDLIAREDMVVSITNQGYIKRMSVDLYKAQHRGGKGIIAMETKEGDFVEELFIASTHDYLLFFTDKGRVYWLKVYQIPLGGRYARGKAVVNLLNLGDEKISTAIRLRRDNNTAKYLALITKRGLIKKTDLSSYQHPRKKGIIAINLRDEDKLVCALLTSGNDEILISTEQGKAIRFRETDARPLGRTSMGVKAITLSPRDSVVGAVVVDRSATLLTVTEKGYGKRTPFDKYPLQHRGGKGVIDIKTSGRNGSVVSSLTVHDNDEIMSITSDGVVIRTPVSGISKIGRNTQGVKIMRLEGQNRVVSVARVPKEEI